MNIHQKIKQMRERACLTQKELGKMVGTSDRAVLNWEQDAVPRNTKLMKLAEVFDVETVVLTNDDIELPKKEASKKVELLYPPAFAEHLEAIKAQTEQYLSNPELMDDRKLNVFISYSLASIDESLKEILELLKNQKNDHPKG